MPASPKSLTAAFSKPPMSSLINTTKLTHDSYGNFVQKDTGRRITLRGINLDSSTKQPKVPLTTTYMPPSECFFLSGADTVSFVNRPFPLEEAASHFKRIKLLGFNTIRYVITWEAIEHEGPGIYDLDFINYTIEIMKIIENVGGLYVLIDPHQDVWSRFTGGSGAPLWTLHAAGLEPGNFNTTQSALVHNFFSQPEEYPKMVWATNYNRLACQTMFTMFFSGKMFFPKCVIDGMNIQDYLQSHFIESFSFFMKQLKSSLPHLFNTMIIGIETMNEPNKGLFGLNDLNQFPKDEYLKVFTTPTTFQSIKLGMGIPQEVDMYKITIFGPRKTGSQFIDPEGDTTWTSKENNLDSHYGFNRSPEWKLGSCIYAQHGIWDVNTQQLLIPDYFAKDPKTSEELNINVFVNTRFLDFWKSFKTAMRNVDDDLFLVLQSPVMERPPLLKGNSELMDSRLVIAQHFYDGLSLMNKSWNRYYNVDTVGLMKGKYSNPVFGMVFGEGNIRKSFRNQFLELRQDCIDAIGQSVPWILTETGMPFDMDNKRAYEDGDYSSQEGANDALMYALESSMTDFTYWCYNGENNHKWGDNWNLEDFSIFSQDDKVKNIDKYFMNKSNYGEVSYKPGSGSDSSLSSSNDTLFKGAHGTVKQLGGDDNSMCLSSEIDQDVSVALDVKKTLNGTRIQQVVQRPYPVLVNGIIKDCKFGLRSSKFTLTIDTSEESPFENDGNAPTIIYLPDFHFPMGSYSSEVSSGILRYKHNKHFQILEWHHDMNIGEITLNVMNNGQGGSMYSKTSTNFFADCLNILACGSSEF